MTRGRIWDMFQPNWSIFEFYPHIPFDLGFHGQNAVWKNARHVCLVGRTFLCILIHEFSNTNKMGTDFWSETYRLTLRVQKFSPSSFCPMLVCTNRVPTVLSMFTLWIVWKCWLLPWFLLFQSKFPSWFKTSPWRKHSFTKAVCLGVISRFLEALIAIKFNESKLSWKSSALKSFLYDQGKEISGK